MTDPIAFALIGGIAPTLAALGGLFVAIRNSKKSDEIHVLVNSNLTAVKADLALALERVDKLEKLLVTFTGSAPPPSAQ